MADDRPTLLPQPKTVTAREGAFTLDADTQILLLPDASDALVRAARSLQGEIEAITGLRVPLVRTARPARAENVLLLAEDPAAAAAYLPGAPWPVDSLAEHGEQAYWVSVTPSQILAGGRGDEAAHYAAQTLRQLVRGEGARLPALEILDWPSLAYRGVMMDVSRGKVPTLATLERVVDEMSLYKMNVLQLYTEHTFVFPHHPRIGAGCGSLSGDDMMALDAYARDRFVELQPNLNSFGHMAHLLAIPEYRHLAEAEIGWSVDVTNEETYALFDDLYADLLPAFSSTLFNVGCDETWDLGKGRSRALAEEIGVGRVYLQHILRLREIAARYGRRIQIWGDILLHHPELVPELPEDVILLDWHYEAEEDYPSVRTFAESGRTFWVCPGTSSWNTLFPRIENANGNIRTLARLAAEHGGEGLLNTDWGDHGHYQPIGQSWYGYLYGGEQAWTGGQTPDDAFDRALGRLFFGPRGEEIVGAVRALGRLNALEGMPLRNASHSVYMLLEEPLLGEATPQIPAETLREVERVSREAEATLRSALGAAEHPEDLEDLAFSARLMGYAARKAMACLALRDDVRALGAGQGEAEAILSRGVETLRALETELAALTERFREVWLARARHSEIGISLGYLTGLRARLARAGEWFAARLAEARRGETPALGLEDYEREAADYFILGQRGARRWRELGLR
jgi:hexosaminidase